MTNKRRQRIQRGVMVVLAVANGTIATWIIQAPTAGEACVPRTDAYFSYGKYVERQYVSCRTLQDRVYSNVTGCPDNIPYRDCFREQVAVSKRNINWGVSQVRQRFPRWGQPAQAEPMMINATDISRPAPAVPYRQTLPMDFAPAEVQQSRTVYRPPVQQAYVPVAPVVNRSVYSVVPRSRMSACRYDQRFC